MLISPHTFGHVLGVKLHLEDKLESERSAQTGLVGPQVSGGKFLIIVPWNESFVQLKLQIIPAISHLSLLFFALLLCTVPLNCFIHSLALIIQ